MTMMIRKEKTGKANTGYTCADYRAEMILLTLHRRLSEEALSGEDRAALLKTIRELETEMGLD